MKHYKQLQINSFEELSEAITKSHLTGLCLGFFYNNGIFRVFSNNPMRLDFIDSKLLLVPEHKHYVKCHRVRSAERQTPIQRKKRMEKLKIHLAKKGIDFKPDRIEQPQSFDYFVNIKSVSNKHAFTLYIKNTIFRKDIPGSFSSYGLSLNGSTLPYF